MTTYIGVFLQLFMMAKHTHLWLFFTLLPGRSNFVLSLSYDNPSFCCVPSFSFEICMSTVNQHALFSLSALFIQHRRRITLVMESLSWSWTSSVDFKSLLSQIVWCYLLWAPYVNVQWVVGTCLLASNAFRFHKWV